MTDATTRRLIDDLRAVIADAEALVDATVDDLGERAKAARAKAGESVDKAQAGLDELETQLAARAEDLARDATEYVRNNPWTAVGIAAAVGAVLGALLSRR